MRASPPPSRALKVGAVLAVLAVLAVAHRFGILTQFAEPSRAAKALVELGAVGYLAFVVAYAVLQPFGVPGTAFIVAAALIWPWPVAFALSMTGTMAASVVGFAFSRLVARDWVSARIPARFAKYDDALEKRAFTTVFVLRLVFWMPPMLHAFFGVSRVSFWTHFWGSLAGYALPLLLVSYFGQAVFDAMKNAPIALWIGLGAAVALAALVAWAWRRCAPSRARAEVVAEGHGSM